MHLHINVKPYNVKFNTTTLKKGLVVKNTCQFQKHFTYWFGF